MTNNNTITSREYEVRFNIFQYNSEGADNGYYRYGKRFTKLKDARAFYKQIMEWLETDTCPREFIERYVWQGNLISVDGLWKITHERMTYDNLKEGYSK